LASSWAVAVIVSILILGGLGINSAFGADSDVNVITLDFGFTICFFEFSPIIIDVGDKVTWKNSPLSDIDSVISSSPDFVNQVVSSSTPFSFTYNSAGTFSVFCHADVVFPSLTVIVNANPDVVSVSIDIKPGSDPNSVNCENLNGNVLVAVFGSADFDVSTIDKSTLKLNGIAVTEVHDKIHIEDKNGDEFPDAVLHLDKAGVCEATQDASLKESVDATLTGSTIDDQDFEGTDDIRIVKR